MIKPVELLAPAGDEDSLFAALRAGADAVYFGLDAGFNARIRANNISLSRVPELMQQIHELGRRGYVTLNTLVFDHELVEFASMLERLAMGGVDAVIVQDLGLARWIAKLCPTLRLHASTQMTCTDLRAIEVAASLGASRVTLARELSLEEIRLLSHSSPTDLEVFAHGALCISYSGQCLTSEAIGGRSANRGACAQACRLPYDLIVDGVRKELGDIAYLLSPQDLDTSERVPELISAGVAALKIEGRLKGPEYVTAATHLYRKAIDAAMAGRERVGKFEREAAAQAFSRGTSFGFLDGTNHQALVGGETCDHVGVAIGSCHGVSQRAGKSWLRLASNETLCRGDGLLIQGGRAGKDEFGGRIWGICVAGLEVEQASLGDDIWVWLGPDKSPTQGLEGHRVYRTSAPRIAQALKVEVAQSERKIALSAILRGRIGEAPELCVRVADGRSATVALEGVVQQAQKRPLDEATAREKLSRLGETPFELTEFSFELAPMSTLSLSALNRGRREAIELLARAAHRACAIDTTASLESQLSWPNRPAPRPGLFVTCRNLEQAEAALLAGADGIYLDFLALTGVGQALRALRERATHSCSFGVVLPRVAKPKEEKIEQYLRGLGPDMLLLRALGDLHAQGSPIGVPTDDEVDAMDCLVAPHTPTELPLRIADFSLNVANSLTAIELLRRGLSAFTPSYDLDAGQLLALLASPLAPYAEVVVHHPMPLFHMEHCVIAARLSSGRDHRDCGRPCEKHQVVLRDRTGLDLPVEADVGCRNTVFHGKSQSAADHLARLRAQGVTRFRIELLRETANATDVLVRTYRGAIDGSVSPQVLRQELGQIGLSVVRGSLRVVG